MNWFYKRTEKNLFTVGFEDSKGEWYPDSDHESEFEVAHRVAYLNGSSKEIMEHLQTALSQVEHFRNASQKVVEGIETEVKTGRMVTYPIGYSELVELVVGT